MGDDDETLDDGTASDLNIIDVHKPTADNIEDECTCGLCRRCTCEKCNDPLSLWLDAILCPKFMLSNLSQLNTMLDLLAHRHSNFNNLVSELEQYRAERQCGVAWPPGHVAYRCHTCSSVVTMALCADCFRNGDHTGHNYNMFKSRSGGACDCGFSIMKDSGVCKRHGRNATKADEPIPETLICIPRRSMGRLVHRLAFQLRRSHVDLAGETDKYLDFLDMIANSGAILRTLMIDAMVSDEIYSSQLEFLSNHSDKEVARTINEGIKKLKRERKGLSTFKLPENWGLKRISAFCDNLEPRCFVDELMFWVVVFEFPQKLVCFLLGFLMDERYKQIFAKAFVNHYPRLVMLLAGVKGETRMRQLRDSFEQLSRRLLQVSVQIYNNQSLTMMLCEEDNTLHTLIYCLRLAIEGSPTEGLRGVLKFNPLCQNNSYTPKVVCCDNPIIRDRYLGSFAEDLNAILDFKDAAILLVNDQDLLDTWLGMLSYFQTMSPYKRELTEHTPYETGPHISVFTVEADFCLTPLWSMLNRLKGEQPATISLLQSLHKSLTTWFYRMDIGPNTVLDPYYMSFHIPLHRMFAATMRHLLFIQNKRNSDICTSLDCNRYIPAAKSDYSGGQLQQQSRNIMTEKEFFRILALHPLQALTLYHETRSSMWTRNGLMTINQAVTYVHYAYCYSTVDLDMFLLRYCASKLEPNHFLKLLMTRFHAWKWLSFKSNNLMMAGNNSGDSARSMYNSKFSILPEQITLMVENSLVVLIQLLTLSLHCNISEREQTRQEMIALISVVDRSYSFLIEMLPDRNVAEHNVSDKNFVSLLAELTNYKPAQHGIGGDLRQGCYTLKPEVWDEDYDPMQVQHRFYQKRDYQMSLERFFQHSKLTGKLKKRFHPSTLWPPLKIPRNIANFGQLDLSSLLDCPALVGLVYSIIYKNLYIVDVPDAVMAYAMHLLEMALRKSIDDTSDEKKDGVRKKNHSFTGRYCYSELRSCPSYFGSKGEAQIKGSSLYSAAPSTTSVVSLTQSSKLGCGRDDEEADRREDGLFPVVRHALDLAFDTTWFPFTSVRDNCLVFVENVYSMPPKEFEVMLRYEARCDERSAAAAAAAAVAGKAATSWAPEELIEGDDDVDNDDEDDGEDDLDEDDSGEYEDDNDEVNDEEEDENDDDELDEDDNEDDANDDADVDEEADEEEEEDEHQRRQQDVRRADGLQQRGHLSNVGRLNSGAAAALPPDTDSDGELTELARQHRSYLAGLRGRRHNWFARRGGSSSAGGSGSSSTQDRATNTRSYWFDRLPDVGQAEHPQVATVGGSATSATLGVGSPSSTTSQNLTRTTYTNTNTQSRSMSRQVRSVFSLQPHEQMYWDDEQRASSLAAAAAAAVAAQHNREPPVSAVSLDRARGQVSAGHEASGLAESQPMSLVESAADSDSVEMIAVAGNVVEPTGLAAIALAAERLTYEVSPQQQQQQQPSGNLGASTAPQDHTYSAREVPMELEESSLPPSQSNALSLLPLHHHQLASSSSAGSTTQIYPENLVTERRAILASDPRPMIAGSAQPLALELPRSAAAAAERNSSSSSSAAALAQMSQLTRLQQPSMQSRHNPATTSAAATTSSERQPQPQSGASQLSEVDIHARFMGFFQGGANGSGGGARLDARSSSRAFRQRPTARRGGYRAGPVAPFAVHNPNSVSAAASAAAALAAMEAPTSPPTQTASNSMHLLSQIQQLQHRQRTPAQQDATNAAAAADDAAPGSSSAATVQPPQPPPSSRIRICANAMARRSNLTGNNLASAASAAYTLLNRSAILKRRGHRYSHSLGRQDQRRTLRRKDRLHQGESLLSLLLRLHAKYSQRPNFFQYNELRAKENLQLNRSRIGDGLHFVNIVLDLICNLDRNHRGGRMRATLERLQDLIWPSDKAVSTAASSASKKKEDKSEEVAAAATAAAAKCDDIGIDIKTNSRPNSPLQPPPPQQPEACQPGAGSSHSSSEQQQQHQQQQQQRPLSPNERRRKAKEFQRRLMADFASKQRAFIEKYEAREQPLSDKVAAATSALPDEEPINLSSKLDRPTSDGDRDKRQQPASSSSSSSLPATTTQQQQSPRQLDKRVSMESEQQQPPAADEWLSAETSGPSTSSTTSHPECCICGLSGPADLANPLGQVVLLQSSSVWGHSHLEPAQYRPLPCEEAVQVSLKERTYAKYLERRIDLLCEHFSQFSWLDSINIGAEGGVHVQSCGHYLHIECHQSYIKSLDQEDRLRARTDTDEFLCPVCRQLANSVLPILSNSCFGASGAVAALPGSLSAAQEKPSTVFSLDEQVEQVAALLSRRLTPNQKELHSSAAFCSHLTKATGPQYRLVRSCEPSMHSLFLFLTSIARTNLETELVVRHTVRQQGYVSALVAGSARRSCFQLLFRVLALNAQTLINDQWFTCDHIWSHLTHRVDEKNRLSVKPLNSEVPLLLRDPTAMLLQFLFAIPQPLCKATNFTCLVQILFNLAAVQSIALLLSYLSADTFQALLLEPPETTTTTTTTTSTTKPTEQQGPENNLRALVSLVARNLAPLLRHREQPLANPAVRSRWPLFDPTCQIDEDEDEDDDNDDGDDIYCAPTPIRLRTDNEDDDDQVAVQWPVLQTLIKLALLPYLRAASLLQHHLHPTQPYPSQLDEPRNASAIELDFRSLVTCLRLTSGGDENNSQMHLEEALSSWWPRGERDALLADWCGELMRFGAEFSIAARSLLVCRPLAWHRPALMRLPEAFDDVFMFYYRKKCSLCQQVPKDVAVCLVCGAPICFRVSCCKDRSRSRQVHSQHCGANTAVFLAVHTSSIVVIRGSRACVWGSVYLDAHDEEDNGLQRGKPLYLVQARFALLQEQWLTHSFDHTCGKRWIYLQENQ